jgi:hypothetical protein
LNGFLRTRDRFRGMLGGLFRFRLDLLTDHSIRQYAHHIATAASAE